MGAQRMMMMSNRQLPLVDAYGGGTAHGSVQKVGGEVHVVPPPKWIAC